MELVFSDYIWNFLLSSCISTSYSL
jgi:hypothetical protein